MIAAVTLLMTLSIGFIANTNALDAQLTSYCSYPPCCDSNPSPPYTSAEKKHCPDKSECDQYGGCDYEGEFAFCGKKTHSWVIKNNITAFFSTHGDINKYKGKKLRVKQGSKSIDVLVCDTCADSDCNNCCTKNAGKSGYLIDLESNTYERFKGKDGAVTWSCLNC